MQRDRVLIFSLVGVMLFSSVAFGLTLVASDRDGDLSTIDSTTTIPLNNQEDTAVSCDNPSSEEELNNKDIWPVCVAGPLNELRIIDIREGFGPGVELNSSITVNYRLSLADGTPVEGNDTFAAGEPITFELVEGGLIEGWIQGIPGMQLGGYRRLLVPAELAYGASGRPGIPPNADLIFDVELTDIE